jgi:small subunit ribosomal protein S21
VSNDLSGGVRAHPGEHIDSVLRRFKKSTEKSGLLFEMRKRAHFTPPSAARRIKSRAARKRIEK